LRLLGICAFWGFAHFGDLRILGIFKVALFWAKKIA